MHPPRPPAGEEPLPAPLIVHYHIFKNAGTSVDEALHRCFGPAWRTFEGAHAHDVKTADEVRAFLAANPGVRALSTHLGRPPLPHARSYPIVFLRHPILRARSAFEFLRRDPTHPGPKDSLPAFVEWALDSPDGAVIRDYQVVHLSSASFTRPSILEAKATPEDLEAAARLLGAWGTVGIVEDYERSLERFQRRYGSQVPGLQLRPYWMNSTTSIGPRPMHARLEEIRILLGETLLSALTQANRLDLALYTYARRLAANADDLSIEALRPAAAPVRV